MDLLDEIVSHIGMAALFSPLIVPLCIAGAFDERKRSGGYRIVTVLHGLFAALMLILAYGVVSGLMYHFLGSPDFSPDYEPRGVGPFEF